MLSPGTLLSRFHEYSHTHGLFGERDTVIVGVSGGIDSMVLLDLLARERGLTIIVAHFNHQLRGDESDGDEAFVAGRARHYGVSFQIARADTAGEAGRQRRGIQETARDLRYAFFGRLRETAGAARIATAHHADDNAETILLHLFRGTGVQGMTGIQPLRPGEAICRPLLFARREEIEAYGKESEIPFRSDSSNDKDGYTRNAVRHHILPLLKEFVSPSVVENINRSGEHFRGVEEYLSDETRRALEASVTYRGHHELHLSLPRLTFLTTLIRHRVLFSATEECTGNRSDHVHVTSLDDLRENAPGTRVMLPGGFEALRDRDELVLRARTPEEGFSIAIEPEQEYRVGDFRFSSRFVERAGQFPGADRTVEYVDADRITSRGLTFRSWRDGDAFIPLGMSARKKVSDFFVDEKVPVHEKRRFPILATGDGDVVWICGKRIDDRFKITPATRRVLKLEFSATSDR